MAGRIPNYTNGTDALTDAVVLMFERLEAHEAQMRRRGRRMNESLREVLAEARSGNFGPLIVEAFVELSNYLHEEDDRADSPKGRPGALTTDEAELLMEAVALKVQKDRVGLRVAVQHSEAVLGFKVCRSALQRALKKAA